MFVPSKYMKLQIVKFILKQCEMFCGIMFNLANHHTQLDNQKCQANLGDPFGMIEGHFERSSAHFVLFDGKKTKAQQLIWIIYDNISPSRFKSWENVAEIGRMIIYHSISAE